MTDTPQTPTKTSVGRTWLIKFLIFFIASAGLGAWFFYDGLVAYPNNAAEHARFTLLNYLEALDNDNRLRPANASVDNPADTFAELSAKATLTETETQQLNWLKSLTRIRELQSLAGVEPDPIAQPGDHNYLIATTFPNPRQTLADLDAYFQQRDTPTALAAYDIPVQLILGAVSAIAALFVFLRIAKTLTTSYAYDPHAHRITGPGFDATPETIKLLDKRKWDKFLVFVNFNDDRPEHKLDLYRFDPLESWILEIEKLSADYEPEPNDGLLLLADVLDATARNQIVPDDTPSPIVLENDQGAPTRYPAHQDVAGRWFIIGRDERAKLKQAADTGQLPKDQLKVNLDTFEITAVQLLEDEQPAGEDATQTEEQNAD